MASLKLGFQCLTFLLVLFANLVSSHNVNLKHDHNDGSPCLMPPSPALIERYTTRSNFTGTNGTHSPPPPLNTTGLPRSVPAENTPGINDDIIFPEANPNGTNPNYNSTHSKWGTSRAARKLAPLRGSIRVAVVLVDFSDKPMGAGANDHFKDLFFSYGKISTGSVTEYFSDVSRGKVNFRGDVVGPFRLPHTLAEYAHQGFGYGQVAPNAKTMAADALTLARNSIDFSTYDNDGNGYVDAFIVVHAGRGAEETGSSGDIWSLKWTIDTPVQVNGVNVYGFLTIPEDAKLGVCAHEIGHLVFGWPDLYDTDYSSNGIGSWCLMSGGSWGGFPSGTTPTHPSAWCKKDQEWVEVENETTNRRITVNDVKKGGKIHRLWTHGMLGDEHFLVENRERTGYDASLPGQGLLVWHVDDSITQNSNELHPKVALLQADGKNELAISSGSSGDTGDPYPGSSNNLRLAQDTTPNSRSYASLDTLVSIRNIPAASESMSFDITVNEVTTGNRWIPVFKQGNPGPGIGGYDVRSKNDLAFAFDYDHSGRRDHIVLYRPGSGCIWIIKNSGGVFSPVFKSTTGIGGYDLKSTADRVFAFDYNHNGRLDHLVLYRPGRGAIFVLRHDGGNFRTVYAQGGGGRGIGGFDLRSVNDRIIAYDYNGSGHLDHLVLWRAGGGAVWILANKNGVFKSVYTGTGIGGYDLLSVHDRLFAYDWNGSGKRDHLALYRPGTGTFWCVRRNGNSYGFRSVMSVGDPGNGVGGYDLRSKSDVLFAFDYESKKKANYIVSYRPGHRAIWILKHNGGTQFAPVFKSDNGIGGYDLRSGSDKIFAFDYGHKGVDDHLAIYRPGDGIFWILKRT